MMRAVKTRLDAAAKAGDVPLAHSGKSGAVRDIAAKLRWSKTKPSSATKLGGKSAQAASFRDSLGSHLSPGERGRAIKKFLDKLHGG